VGVHPSELVHRRGATHIIEQTSQFFNPSDDQFMNRQKSLGGIGVRAQQSLYIVDCPLTGAFLGNAMHLVKHFPIRFFDLRHHIDLIVK